MSNIIDFEPKIHRKLTYQGKSPLEHRWQLAEAGLIEISPSDRLQKLLIERQQWEQEHGCEYTHFEFKEYE